MKTPDAKIKSEPVNSSSFLGSLHSFCSEEVSDAGNNDEEASKPIEKRQYIGALNLFLLVFIINLFL